MDVLGLGTRNFGSHLPIPRGVTHDGDAPLLHFLNDRSVSSCRGVSLTAASVILRQLLIVDERVKTVIAAHIGDQRCQRGKTQVANCDRVRTAVEIDELNDG